MTISTESVAEKFRLYSGEEPDGNEPAREALCRELCRECAAWVAARIKPDLTDTEGTESEREALECLAAAEAFWQLAALDQAAAPQGVGSGEIKIQLGDRLGAAQRLRDEKGLACRGLTVEDGFYFGTA